MKESLFAAHHDLETRHWWFRGRRRAIRDVGMLLAPSDGRIVDVGCGTGADIAAFPDGCDRHGIDIAPTAIAFAQQSYPDVAFEVGAVPEAGETAIAAADLVLLCDVLEHIEDDAGFLSALVDMMSPRAHLLLTVPAEPRLWSPHDEVYGHYRRYTRDSLAELWSAVPVTVRLLAPFNRRLYPVVRAARAASARWGRGWGSESSDLRLPLAPVNAALERLFGGEAKSLVRALESGHTDIPGRGVSLMAVLERGSMPGTGTVSSGPEPPDA